MIIRRGFWSSSAINIILATSLNLINGFTGQFSIGHAGFMAVGAYASAYFSVTYGQGDRSIARAAWRDGRVERRSADRHRDRCDRGRAMAGLIVGIPSLRLKGDYLAIVTLGFAEIIRIVILNIDCRRRSDGISGAGLCQFFVDRNLCGHHRRRHSQHR